MKTIGETFGIELIAAGCNNGVSFTIGSTDAVVQYGIDANIAAVEAVIAAHDHTAKLPDRTGFSEAINAAVLDVIQLNLLTASYPLLFPAIANGIWPDVQALIIDSKAKSFITTAQYSAIKTASSTFNIPVTL